MEDIAPGLGDYGPPVLTFLGHQTALDEVGE